MNFYSHADTVVGKYTVGTEEKSFTITYDVVRNADETLTVTVSDWGGAPNEAANLRVKNEQNQQIDFVTFSNNSATTTIKPTAGTNLYIEFYLPCNTGLYGTGLFEINNGEFYTVPAETAEGGESGEGNEGSDNTDNETTDTENPHGFSEGTCEVNYGNGDFWYNVRVKYGDLAKTDIESIKAEVYVDNNKVNDVTLTLYDTDSHASVNNLGEENFEDGSTHIVYSVYTITYKNGDQTETYKGQTSDYNWVYEAPLSATMKYTIGESTESSISVNYKLEGDALTNATAIRVWLEYAGIWAESDAVEGTLTVSNLQPNTTYKYWLKCEITLSDNSVINPIPNDFAIDFKTLEATYPTFDLTSGYDNVTSNGATIYYNTDAIPEGYTVTEAKWTNASDTNHSEPFSAGNSFTFTDLAANSEYTFKIDVTATNENNEIMVGSSTVSFTTLQEAVNAELNWDKSSLNFIQSGEKGATTAQMSFVVSIANTNVKEIESIRLAACAAHKDGQTEEQSWYKTVDDTNPDFILGECTIDGVDKTAVIDLSNLTPDAYNYLYMKSYITYKDGSADYSTGAEWAIDMTPAPEDEQADPAVGTAVTGHIRYYEEGETIPEGENYWNVVDPGNYVVGDEGEFKWTPNLYYKFETLESGKIKATFTLPNDIPAGFVPTLNTISDATEYSFSRKEASTLWVPDESIVYDTDKGNINAENWTTWEITSVEILSADYKLAFYTSLQFMNGVTRSTAMTYTTGGTNTGINGIQVNNAVYVSGGNIVAPEGAEIYNLNGVRISGENATSGIYIVRVGSKAVKVLVK